MEKKRIFIVTALFCLALYQLFAFSGHGRRHESNYTIPEGMDLTNVNVPDGVYEGTAVGFREGLTVEVTVKDSQVVNIEVVDHNEIGRRYYQRPIDLIPKEILKTGNTEVDAVSGATCTSFAIMSAVENALDSTK